MIPTELIIEAREQVPGEACGILLGPKHGAQALSQRDHITAWRPLGNIATGDTSFRLDPIQYAREQQSARTLDMKILGVFHSHPAGRAQPSGDDERRARALWGQDSSWLYLIIGLAEDSRCACRVWRMQRGFWREVSLRHLPLSTASV